MFPVKSVGGYFSPTQLHDLILHSHFRETPRHHIATTLPCNRRCQNDQSLGREALAVGISIPSSAFIAGFEVTAIHGTRKEKRRFPAPPPIPSCVTLGTELEHWRFKGCFSLRLLEVHMLKYHFFLLFSMKVTSLWQKAVPQIILANFRNSGLTCPIYCGCKERKSFSAPSPLFSLCTSASEARAGV